MAFYEYAIAVGSDQTTLTNVEDIVTDAPVGKPLPLGSVTRKTLDHKVQTNGTRIVPWSWAAMSKEDFQALIVLLFGDFETENVDVTVDTRDRDENFVRANATAHLPLEGIDYQRRDHGKVENLVLTLDNVQPFSAAFTTGFTIGFEA